MVRAYGILLHGGARTKKISGTSDKGESIKRYIGLASMEGYSYLKRGNNATDAVEAAVVILEDSGIFNAGAGSCLTIDGNVEMDASIMSGNDLSAGSVGMVRGISNPIKLARSIMKEGTAVMLVSNGASEFAKLINMPIRDKPVNEEIMAKYRKLKKKTEKQRGAKYYTQSDEVLDIDMHGTVGAVAIDIQGDVATAVSTGGRWLKMGGRVGDSAIIGAGSYADNTLGAACATGYGEFIMRLCLSRYACDRMRSGGASSGCKEAIRRLSRIFGTNTGGIIAVDRHGRFGVEHNTPSMPISFMSNRNERNMTFLSSQNEYLKSYHLTD